MGNTSVTLSLASSWRAGATSGTNPSDRTRFVTDVNGYSSSSHCVLSMSSCHCDRYEKILRCSKVERGGKDELQTCARHESCQSDGVHEISKDKPS